VEEIMELMQLIVIEELKLEFLLMRLALEGFTGVDVMCFTARKDTTIDYTTHSNQKWPSAQLFRSKRKQTDFTNDRRVR
jgi:hypothetical protein